MGLYTRNWVLAAHLIGVVFWMGGLFAVYWVQRLHVHAPKDTRDKLTLMERSLAMMMDIAAGFTIGCGVALAVSPINLFTANDSGWLHAKLAVVVLGILPVHAMTRRRVRLFSRGDTPRVPEWQWSVLLLSVALIMIFVTTRLHFAPPSE